MPGWFGMGFRGGLVWADLCIDWLLPIYNDHNHVLMDDKRTIDDKKNLVFEKSNFVCVLTRKPYFIFCIVI